jgi:hypothetical protein
VFAHAVISPVVEGVATMIVAIGVPGFKCYRPLRRLHILDNMPAEDPFRRRCGRSVAVNSHHALV